MFKHYWRDWILVFAVLLFSAVLLALASYAEFSVQDHITWSDDVEFMAYTPGRYTLYCESIVDKKALIDGTDKDYHLNGVPTCSVQGRGHLKVLTPKIRYAGGIPYCIKDSKSEKYRIGIPFAELEILWPGPYQIHPEFPSNIEKHPHITVGPKGFIAIAIALSIMAQIIVICIILRKSK